MRFRNPSIRSYIKILPWHLPIIQYQTLSCFPRTLHQKLHKKENIQIFHLTDGSSCKEKAQKFLTQQAHNSWSLNHDTSNDSSNTNPNALKARMIALARISRFGKSSKGQSLSSEKERRSGKIHAEQEGRKNPAGLCWRKWKVGWWGTHEAEGESEKSTRSL